MRREILCCLFPFALLTLAFARELVLFCDSQCWPKGLDANNATEHQILYCKRIFRADTEGGYWEGLFNNGEIAVGALMTVMNSDAPPDPGATNCAGRYGPENAMAYEVRVTGFAYQTKVCNISHGPWKKGYLLSIEVCGLTNNGKTVTFFPAHPLP